MEKREFMCIFKGMLVPSYSGRRATSWRGSVFWREKRHHRFSKGLAREMARYSINENCVCLGPTDTPLFDRVPEKHQEAFIRAIPMRRLSKPAEMAHAVMFFASLTMVG